MSHQDFGSSTAATGKCRITLKKELVPFYGEGSYILRAMSGEYRAAPLPARVKAWQENEIRTAREIYN